MPTENLLYKKEYPINDDIKIMIPTVGEVVEDEDNYYSIISMLTSMPIDMMVVLDDAGIDFTQINEYEMFLLFFPMLKAQDTHLVFGDLDLSGFEVGENEANGTVVLVDRNHDIVIDRGVYEMISGALRKIHHLERNMKKPANKEAQDYLIERARKKARRQRKMRNKSHLESLIISMVNSEPYKYDFEGTRELSIYQFNESVRQVLKKTEFNNRMLGVYTGNISAEKMSQDDFNWLADNKK